eukprot:gene17550-biopygen18897
MVVPPGERQTQPWWFERRSLTKGPMDGIDGCAQKNVLTGQHVVSICTALRNQITYQMAWSALFLHGYDHARDEKAPHGRYTGRP